MQSVRACQRLLASSAPSRPLLQRQSKRFAGHGDDLLPEDAAKDIGLWKKASFAGVIFLVAFGIKIAVTPERPHVEKKAYSHLEVRRKAFPWGDGNTSMFANLFGKPHGDHHEHDDHAKGHH